MDELSLQPPSPTSSTPDDEIEKVNNDTPTATTNATAPNDINFVLQDLHSRITKLEQARFECPTEEEDDNNINNNRNSIVVDNAMRRARQAVEMAGCYSARWIWVPSNYYQWNLQDRALFLQVPTTAVLCKSLLMENKKWVSSLVQEGEGGGGEYDAFNPKFVLVVLQYEATLDVTKLHVALQRYRLQQTKSNPKVNQQQYDWRIASPEDNDAVTGYSFNSVTPFGMLSPHVKIVLASAIVHQQQHREQECKYFVMGGGHVHLKLKMVTSEFIEATNALVADVTNPRAGVVNDDEY